MPSITELLDPTPAPLWRIGKQAGVDEVVTLHEEADQRASHWNHRIPMAAKKAM